MAGIEAVKDLVKPPFANYDIVVYFGCGLFSLPFVMHYVGNFRAKTTSFKFDLDPPFVATLITTLSVLFAVYILGHIIAYLSSQLIEKLMDSMFGKPSTIVYRGSSERRSDFRKMIKEQSRFGLSRHISDRSYVSSAIRFLAHVPLFPFYSVILFFEIFGYHRTRVSDEVINAAVKKMKQYVDGSIDIALQREWFKALEALVANNNSVATARLYNYLVISGLFRSICFIFLVSSWFELAYAILRLLGHSTPAGLLMFGNTSTISQLFSYIAMCLLYLFSLFSYFKFQRRYVEDAIFAFVFTDAKPTVEAPCPS